MEQDAELKAAREKLAARFADAAQIGGKGKRPSHYVPFRHPEKKEEACCRPECQRGQEA